MYVCISKVCIKVSLIVSTFSIDIIYEHKHTWTCMEHFVDKQRWKHVHRDKTKYRTPLHSFFHTEALCAMCIVLNYFHSFPYFDSLFPYRTLPLKDKIMSFRCGAFVVFLISTELPKHVLIFNHHTALQSLFLVKILPMESICTENSERRTYETSDITISPWSILWASH